jgi:ribosomal protein S18 acetylase RimI-like enzyme
MDIQELVEVTDEVVAAFARLFPQLTPAEPPDRKILEDIVRSEASTIFVAIDDAGEIVGTLTLAIYAAPTGKHAWIEDVIVDERARGRGIGEDLTRRAIEKAALLGASGINLTSRPERRAANRLYQRVGFILRATNTYRYPLEN